MVRHEVHEVQVVGVGRVHPHKVGAAVVFAAIAAHNVIIVIPVEILRDGSIVGTSHECGTVGLIVVYTAREHIALFHQHELVVFVAGIVVEHAEVASIGESTFVGAAVVD